jgi:aspartyl protease family protein
MYLVVGSINGYPVDFVVDTGATLVSLSGREARRLGIDYRVVGTPGQSSTASGIDTIYLVNLDRVKVGDIELRNVRGAVHDGDFPPATLLGMSFLSRLTMRQDGQVLELKKKF